MDGAGATFEEPTPVFRPSELRLIESAAEIAQSAPVGDDLSFIHAAFTQVSLPRTKQTSRDYFHQVGDTWMRVNAGSISLDGREHKRDLPYGAMARLAIARINTHVVRFGGREVPIASSAHAWLKALGKSDSKLHSDRARSVLADLSACTLILGRGDRTLKESIVRSVNGWQSGPNGQLWPTSIEVSRDYFEEVKAHAVPLDFRALKCLSGSSLALDIYTWLSYRLHRVKAPERISWGAIESQFSTASEQLGDWRGSWRRSFRRQLAAVQVIYARDAVSTDARGVVIRHCQPPVAKRDVDKSCE